MTQESSNSKPAQRQRKDRDAADYIYQGATIVAALLLVLSAAV